MQKIKWGIIGCGDVTEKKSGPAFNKVPGSELVAVMRRDAAKAADYARRHGVPNWYANATALINDVDVNAIYIATPPSSHLDYTLQALAAGKPVYVEKPMALHAGECRQMAEAAKQYNTRLTVAHYRRAVPLFMQVKELLASAAIGAVRSIQLTMLMQDATSKIAQTADNWRVNPALSGGGYFHDLAPHQLDLIYHWFGQPLKVQGLSSNQAGLYGVADTVAGQMLLPNGISFSGQWCFCVAASTAKDECVITGSEGQIRFPFFGNYIELHNADGNQRFDFVHPEHIQQPMIAQVVQYFSGDNFNPCTAEEAAEVMAIMDKITA